MRIARVLLVSFLAVQSISFLTARPQEEAQPQPQNQSQNQNENQQPAEVESQDLTVEQIQVLMELETIQLRFLVRDADGNFMRNLTARDFTVMENGHEQNISLLKEQQVPISSVIMVDNSWSTSQFLAKAAQVAVDFFKGLQPEASAFILFAEQPRVVIDWTEQAKDLAPQLNNVKPNGKTALYDSVIWASKNLFKDKIGKKLIVLLTDGIDTASRSSFQEMMKVTRDQGITLYPIIYTNQYIENYRRNLKSTPGYRRPRSVSNDFHNLILMQNRFIDQSLRFGGRTIFSNAFSDLHNIYGDIIHEMKSQYVMLYQSTDLDTAKREVKIQTKKGPGRIFIEISH
ncbi:MAG: VWA domain-containing protein [Acidobacteria bacterium]|nr:MAG: VWA domain-containing protein [Acidobacteriota bacterium]